LLCDVGSHIQPNINTGRVTAELEGGVIVYAQRFKQVAAMRRGGRGEPKRRRHRSPDS
jgi:hypothetical protein